MKPIVTGTAAVSRKVKILGITAGVLLTLVIAVYIGISLYFTNRFFPNTYINHMEVSSMNLADAKQYMEDALEDYSLVIYDKDGNSHKIFGIDFDYKLTADLDVGNFLEEQNSFSWPATMSLEQNYQLPHGVSYDEEKLKQLAAQLPLILDYEKVEPKDAYVDSVDGKYQIIEGVTGYDLDAEKIERDILSAVAEGQTELSLTDYEIVTAPAVTADSEALAHELEQLTLLEGIEIIHQFSSQERVLDEEKIRSWVEYDDNNNILVNREAVYDYVLSLAYEFNTFGTNRPFVTSDGRNIEIEGGDYGWIINKDAETDYLVELIQNGTSETREPIYENTANTHDGVDTGEPDTYVEIDLTNQYLWYYVDGSVYVESPIVSGMKNKWDTREGTFAVMFTKRDYNLIGETWDVMVDYFVAFYTNVGMHDASWISTFGGNMNETRGSHGCINMPYDAVEKIANHIPDGTIVYCYY